MMGRLCTDCVELSHSAALLEDSHVCRLPVLHFSGELSIPVQASAISWITHIGRHDDLIATTIAYAPGQGTYFTGPK